MLGVILALFPGEEEPKPAADTSAEPTASEAEDYGDVVIEPAVEEETPAAAIEKKPGGKLFIVIDDVGNNLSDLQTFLNLKVPLTFAVMPGRAFSEESVKLIREAGLDIILHQPMEPVGGQNPGDGAITTGMDQNEIYRILDKNLAAYPAIKGMNNHMGSKVTADLPTMKAVMSYLKQKDMFFLDSVTTNQSVAEEVASAVGVPFAKRNSIFLDNDVDKASVEKAFYSGTEVASAKGAAILIGHVKTGALAEVIADASAELEKKGYTFYGLSFLFKEDGGG